MTDKNLFEQATRKKLRFDVGKGAVSAEDLWDLNLSTLNEIAVGLNRRISASKEEDFLKETTAADTVLVLEFEVVLHVLETLKAEKAKKVDAAKRKEKTDKLTAALARKQDSNLDNMSEDELTAAIAENK